VIGVLSVALAFSTLGRGAERNSKATNKAAPIAAVNITAEAGKQSGADCPEVTVKLRDGTALQCKLLTGIVPVETAYGVLKVPTSDLLIVYLGPRSDKDSGSGSNPSAERDIVVAKEFTVPGRVALDACEVESSLGRNKIALEKVESLSRQPLNVPLQALPASVDTKRADFTESANWRYSDTEEPGWLFPSFDDLQWKPASHLAGGRGTTAIGNKGSILVPGATEGSMYCLRRPFLLRNQPKTASLWVLAESYEAFVNGVKVGAGGSKRSAGHQISQLLRPGLNVIAVKATLCSSWGSGRILDVMMTME
jgi:hypothetical protein